MFLGPAAGAVGQQTQAGEELRDPRIASSKASQPAEVNGSHRGPQRLEVRDAAAGRRHNEPLPDEQLNLSPAS